MLVAISQTLTLGILYFALTGMPGQPRTGASLWQRAQDVFFGLIWGLSMPAFIFISMAVPRHFADLDRAQIIAGLLLAVATVAGWFRTDILVRNRAARPGTALRNPSPVRRVGEWKRFGAMPFLALRQGSLMLSMIMAILLIEWFATEWVISGAKPQTTFVKSQIGLMAMMTGFVVLCNLLGQLRVLRTMPIRTRVLTHWLVFWPLGLAMIVWLMPQLALSLFTDTSIEWHRFGQSLVGAAFMAILLPLALRFGLKLWTILFASVISSAGSFLFGGISEIHGGWWAAAFVTVLAAVWWISYRLLGTPHPWRANAMKVLTPARRM